jgi:hypothetical protein
MKHKPCGLSKFKRKDGRLLLFCQRP